jgi:hypothetical protein
MEILNRLQPRDAAERTRLSSDPDQLRAATEFRTGDVVGFENDSGDFPLAIGTILLLKPADKDRGTDECIVVQVGPRVLGIYRAEQLVRLRCAELRPDMDWNGCALTG